MANEPGTERKKITPGKQGEKPKVEPDPDKAKPTSPVTEPKKK